MPDLGQTISWCTPEAVSRAALEWMAAGRPLVATKVGGLPDIVEDGVTGLLVPPRDPRALADAIVRLLTDHPLADTIARAGRAQVHERFCVERMVSSIQDIYEDGAAVWAGRAALAAAPAGVPSTA